MLRSSPSAGSSSQHTLLTPYRSGAETPEEEEELALLQRLEQQRQNDYQKLPELSPVQPQVADAPRGWAVQEEPPNLLEEGQAWLPGIGWRGPGTGAKAGNSHASGLPVLLAQPAKPALPPAAPAQPQPQPQPGLVAPAGVPVPAAPPQGRPQPLVFRENYDEHTPWEEKQKIRDFFLGLKPQKGVPDLPRAVRHVQFFFDVDRRAKMRPEEQNLMIIPPEFFEKSKSYAAGREQLINHFRHTRGRNIFPGQTIGEYVRSQPHGLTPGGTVPFNIPDTFFDTPTGRFPDPRSLVLGPDSDPYFSVGAYNMHGQGRNLQARMDKDGNLWIGGTVDVSVKDKYDWHAQKSIPVSRSMIARYLPQLYSVKFPNQNESFTIHDSFFKEFVDKGLGKDFDMRSDGFAPLKLWFKDEPRPNPKPPTTR